MSNQVTFSNQQIPNSISDSFDASNIISGRDGNNSELALQATEVTLADLDVLQVTEFNVTGSGFEISFNKPIQESTINLYENEEQKNLFLRDESGDLVNGSIVFKDGFTGFNFVKTGDVLAPGTYNLTLDSVVGSNGEVFDGDQDGQPGGIYTQEFSGVDNEATVLSLADLVLAPGEFVGVSAEDRDLNISIDASAEINQIQFDVEYDPNLLNIKDNFQLADGVPEGWQLQTDFTTSGIAKLTLAGSNPLAAGTQNLLAIEAVVPNNTEYGKTQVLQLKNVQVNNGNLLGIGDTAIHQVAMQGDVSGDGTLSNFDAHLIAQASTGLIDDFAAYPHLDPFIMSDPNQDGDLSTFDAYQTIQRRQKLPEIAIDTINSRFILDDGTNIGGTANGKGAQIAELFYSINDSNAVSAVSPDENGAFNLNLEANATENSVFTLQVTAVDNTGKSNRSEIEVVVPTTTSSGLKYADFAVGDGILPSVGQKVTVDYTGQLLDGTVFDSSIPRGQPFSFNLGGRVIQGWNEGLANMSVGGSRLLIIPPELGYGAEGVTDRNSGEIVIPPNATLLFEVELLEIG